MLFNNEVIPLVSNSHPWLLVLFDLKCMKLVDYDIG